jgi:hypothetical protein
MELSQSVGQKFLNLDVFSSLDENDVFTSGVTDLYVTFHLAYVCNILSHLCNILFLPSHPLPPEPLWCV